MPGEVDGPAGLAAVLRGDRKVAIIALMLIAAIGGNLVARLFLHETHLRHPAPYLGSAVAAARLREGHA